MEVSYSEFIKGSFHHMVVAVNSDQPLEVAVNKLKDCGCIVWAKWQTGKYHHVVGKWV